jgi:hypothetical protein
MGYGFYELKRATLGSEDWPRVGGGPGVGSPGPEKEPAGGRGPRSLGARGGHALTYERLVRGSSVPVAFEYILFL